MRAEIQYKGEEGKGEGVVSCAGGAEGRGRKSGTRPTGAGDTERGIDHRRAAPLEQHRFIPGIILGQSLPAVFPNTAELYLIMQRLQE